MSTFPNASAFPGFRRATRWTSAEGGEGFFVMYELDDYEVLASRGVCSAAQCTHSMVHATDARPSQHGSKPMPRTGELAASTPPERAHGPPVTRDPAETKLRAAIRRIATRSRSSPASPGFISYATRRHRLLPPRSRRFAETPTVSPTGYWLRAATKPPRLSSESLAKAELGEDAASTRCRAAHRASRAASHGLGVILPTTRIRADARVDGASTRRI